MLGNHRGLKWLATAGMLFCAGCSGDSRNLPTSPVSGKVTYKTALPEGQIVFQHPTGEFAATTFGPDGTYKLDVPQGKNQVMVTSMESSAAKDQPKDGPRMMETYSSRIPERYGNFATSKLELDVKPGPNTFDIQLEEK